MQKINPFFWILLFFVICLGRIFSIELPEGIYYSHLFLKEDTSVHILEVDPHLFDIISDRAEREKLETVESIVKRNDAIAGINGGFFRMEGEFAELPMGILKIADEWHATPHKPRGAIGWSNSEEIVLIDQVLTFITAQMGDEVFSIDGINRIREEDQVILYNPCFRRTTCTEPGGIEFVIKNEQVAKIEQNNTCIPLDESVLSVGPIKSLSFSKIYEGSHFFWNLHVIPQSSPPYTNSEDWNHVAYIVGGTPILVRNRQVVVDFSLEKTLDSFLYNRHARTALGLLSNGHWVFVVVDGTKSLFGNLGITIPNLANFMHHLGCVEALNLDGGGSSTLVLNKKVVNVPCGEDRNDQGKKVRKVSDAILVVPKLKPYVSSCQPF